MTEGERVHVEKFEDFVDDYARAAPSLPPIPTFHLVYLPFHFDPADPLVF